MRTTKKLYQWDTDQKLINCVGKYVDYPIGGGVYRIDVIDKECIIPDELLQVSGTVKVYECMEYGTVKAFAFYINPRPKPPDYVFTPTQKLTFEGLVKKVDETIADLQKRADSGEFNGSDYVITESDYDAIAAKTAGKLQPTIGELARTLETEKTDREQADDSLRQDISGKLSEPAEGLAVGKYFRVAALDENGHAVLEAVDAKDVGVQDVQVGGASVVADGVAKVPNATNNAKGVIRGNTSIADSNFAVSGGSPYCITRNASDFYSQGQSGFVSNGTLRNVLTAPSLMSSLTADEQAAARERIGASKGAGTFEDIATVTITEEASAITVNVDSNGNPFSLSDIICEITLPTEDPTKARQIYFGCKLTTADAFSRIALTSNATYITGAITYARIVYGRVISEGAISGPSNTRYQPYQKYALFNGHGGIKAESFDSVSVFTYSDAFPAGTTVALKGARK